MKHLFLVILFAIVVTEVSTAQDTKVMSRKGDMGLMFDLGGLTSLALNGFGSDNSDSSSYGAFGLKYFFGDDFAGRLGLGVMSSSVEDGASRLGFMVAPGVQVNLTTAGPVSGYVGGQIMFRSASVTQDSTQSFVEQVRSTSTLGVGAFIGAEWFPWSNISFAGEYGLGFSTNSGSTETTPLGGGPTVTTDDPSTTEFGLNAQGTITATIYW